MLFLLFTQYFIFLSFLPKLFNFPCFLCSLYSTSNFSFKFLSSSFRSIPTKFYLLLFYICLSPILTMPLFSDLLFSAFIDLYLLNTDFSFDYFILVLNFRPSVPPAFFSLSPLNFIFFASLLHLSIACSDDNIIFSSALKESFVPFYTLIFLSTKTYFLLFFFMPYTNTKEIQSTYKQLQTLEPILSPHEWNIRWHRDIIFCIWNRT